MTKKKEKNFYEILNVEETATLREIKRAYRKKILKFEKELTEKDLDEKLAKKILQASNAYFTLSDTESRIAYDELLVKDNETKIHKRYSSYEKDDYFRSEQEDFVEELIAFLNDFINPRLNAKSFKENSIYATLSVELISIIDYEQSAIKKKVRIKL